MQCENCGGSGKCPTCDGTGMAKKVMQQGDCPDCGGTGRCPDCGGSGVVKDERLIASE